MIPSTVHKSWHPIIGKYFLDERFKKIRQVLGKVVNSGTIICPDMKDVFRAFLLPVTDVKCIIYALSPYQKLDGNKRYATGIAMATPGQDTKTLKIIRDALAHQYHEIAVERYFDNTLSHWTNQGVLLLNKILTVPANTTNAKEHEFIWHNFTIDIVRAIADNTEGIVWGFLGRDAQDLGLEVDFDKHQHVAASHPVYTYYQLVQNGWDDTKVKHFKHENFFLELDKYLEYYNNTKIDWIGYEKDIEKII